MSPGPLVRARHLRSLLDHVRALPGPAGGRVLAAYDAAALRQVDESISTDWLPFRYDLDLSHAVAGVLGPVGTHRFFREHQRAALQGPLFKVLVDSATTIFGMDPGSWARWIPRGWGVVFRECGQWVIDRAGPGEVDLALVAPPPEALEDELWLRALASSFSSFLDLTRCDGEFALERVDRARVAARYRLRWSRRAS